MRTIKFVYFDVGGVLNLDYSGTNKWVEMKRDLGVTEDLDKSFDQVWKKYRSRICIDCDVDTIIPEFEKATGIKIPDDYSMLEDFVNRFDVNHSIWPLAQKAKQKYKVGLLTNQYPRMLDKIKEQNNIPDVNWDVTVDSSIVGFQKPEEKIYEIAEQMAGVNPNDIFFIDNGETHIEVAKKRGWQTLLYNPQDPENSSQKLAEIIGL